MHRDKAVEQRMNKLLSGIEENLPLLHKYETKEAILMALGNAILTLPNIMQSCLSILH